MKYLLKGSSLVMLFFLVLSILGCESDLENTSNQLITNEFNYESSDYYDFSQESKINDLGNFLLKFSDDQIIFDSKHGNMISPFLYENDPNEFNLNGLYKMTNESNVDYYFRFGWVEFIDDKTIFSDVNWLNELSPLEEQSYRISTVNIRFKQEGDFSVCTIGDSQTWFKKSQPLRKAMNYYYNDLIFAGSNTDIYGYGHEGEGGNETADVLKRFEYIPKADYYTILLGTNDYRGSNNLAFRNIILLFQKLTEKFPKSKIIYISPLPSDEEGRNEFNSSLESKILDETIGKANIIYLNLAQKLKHNPNWIDDYMVGDGLHLNSAGLDLFAKEIASIIEIDIELTE